MNVLPTMDNKEYEVQEDLDYRGEVMKIVS